MAFPTTELLKPIQSPIIIVHLDRNELQDFFTNYSPFTWFVNFDAIYPLVDSVFTTGLTAKIIYFIGSVRFDFDKAIECGSVGEVEDLETSFYFDMANNSLYVHCPGHLRPSLFDSIYLGVATVSKRGGSSEYINNVYHPNIVKSIPDIAKRRSDLYYGRAATDGGQIVLINTHGELDTLCEDHDYAGNSYRIYLGFQGSETFPTDFRKISSGVIEKIAISVKEVKISVKNGLKRLKNSIPERYLDITTWTNLEDNNKGSAIPLIYGEVRNVPVICLNEKESAPINWKFLICDTTFHNVKSTYVKPYRKEEKPVALTARAIQYDTVNNIAYFEIPNASSEYEAGNEIYIMGYNNGTATIEDFKGFSNSAGDLITNAIDVIKDLLVNYYSVIYNTFFFNTSHWDSADAYDVGIVINEEKELNDIIVDIAKSSKVTWIVEDDGRFAARIFDETAGVDQSLFIEDLLDYFEIDYDQSKIISKVKIDYDRDYFNKKFISEINESQEEIIFNKYETLNTYKSETYLTDITDVQGLASYILNVFGEIYKQVVIKTNLITIEREIGDIIRVELNRPTSPNLNAYYKGEAVEIKKSITNGQIYITLRLFEKISK